MEEGLTKVVIEHTYSVGKPNQNKKKPRSIIIKFVRCNCRRRIFLNKKNLKNTGISITESLTAKRMKMLNNAKGRFGLRHARTLDGKIYYLRVAQNHKSLEIEQKWHEFLFCVCIFTVTFFGRTIIVNNFSQVSLF